MTVPAAPLALTMGEPAGIGAEIALKAWRDHRDLPPFFLIDDPQRLSRLQAQLGWTVPVVEIAAPEETNAAFARGLPVLTETLPVPSVPGKPDPRNASAVLSSIRRAVDLTRAGRASAVVTNPINKSVLYDAGFQHPGHTEYLAELAGENITPVMLLEGGGLRVVPVTIHMALHEAVRTLTAAAIVEKTRITARALKNDFGIAHPRLAVSGLNPHSGEGGALGREEIEIIEPAIARLKAEGIDVVGPLAADTMFHAGARRNYDVAICMYHDQALIPLKTLDFERGVNVTLGLPFIRTSPDHGTAFDIAGTGTASDASLVAALALAAKLGRQRARPAETAGA